MRDLYSLKNKGLLFFVLFFVWHLVIADTKLLPVDDLRVLKQQAKSRNLPILVLFSAEDCDYCQVLKKNYLLPMIKSGKYDTTIIFRELFIEDYEYIRNEKGDVIAADSLALQYDVEVTPTMLFIDADWHELTARIIGITNADYFGNRLNNSILQAKAAMKKGQ